MVLQGWGEETIVEDLEASAKAKEDDNNPK